MGQHLANSRSDMLRDEVWFQLVETERAVRYYGYLTRRYNRFCWILRGAILLFCMTGITTLVEKLPKEVSEWVSLAVTALLAGAVVLDVIMNYEKKAALLGIISIRCNRLLDRCQDLWNEVNQEELEDEDDLRGKYRLLRDETTDVTGWPSLVGVSEHKRINEKATTEANKAIKNRYAQ